MSNYLGAFHGMGPAGLIGPQKIWPIPAQQVDTGTGSVFGALTLSRVDPLGSILADPFVITSAVTGSSSPQTVSFSYTGDLAADSAAYWLIDPGTATQEIMEGAGGITSTTASCTMFKSHIAGTVVLKIYSVFTKYLLPKLDGSSLINPVFLRFGSLPAGVYDQYNLSGSFGTETYVIDDELPWINGASATPSITSVPLVVPQYDSTLVTGTGKPTNGVAIYVGTITGAGGIYTQPIVQVLFTVSPEPYVAPQYRFWADV